MTRPWLTNEIPCWEAVLIMTTSTTGAQSPRRPWTGIIVEEHRLPPTEFPERTPDRHLIAVHFRPATLEWSLGGHPQTRRIGTTPS
jgi:hypothetical protein